MRRGRGWLRLLSWLVPGGDRDAWLREWLAELEHATKSGPLRVGRESGGAGRVLVSATEDAIRLVPGRVLAELSVLDVGYAARSLRRNPGFALAAVLTLGLGIGANTAIFSVVKAYLLDPLPLPEPDRVVAVVKSQGERVNLTSAPNFVDWRDGSDAFEELAAAHVWQANLTGAAVPLRVERTRVTPGFFEALGVRPVLGRVFDRADGEAGAGAVAILSFELWSSQFGGDPGVLGRSIEIDGMPHTVIGVLPRGLRVPPLTAAVWVPLAFDADALDARGRNNLYVVGRLKEGVTLERSQAEMSALATRLARDYPRSNEGWGIRVLPLGDLAVRSSRAGLLRLLAGVALVLLLACVNVANLVIARGVTRGRELAIRVSLGASRARLLSQLVSESLVLGLAGGAVGLAIAFLSLGPIRALLPASLSTAGDVTIDGAVLAFTLATSLATGVLAGLLPAIRLSAAARRGGNAGGVASSLRVRAATRRLRGGLAVTQFALATVLLVAAGLVLRSLAELYAVDVGIRYTGVTTFGVTFPEATYRTPGRVIAAVDRVTEGLANEHDIAAVAAISHLPLSGDRLTSSVVYEGGPSEQSAAGPSAAIKVVTPGYFELMGIRVLAGRTFDEHDIAASEPVAVINESAASSWWPDGAAVGRWVSYAPDSTGTEVRRRVIGVIADVRWAGPSVPAQPEVYEAHRQTTEVWRWFGRAMTFVVRTSDGRTLGIEPIRGAVGAVDPDLPIVRHTRLADLLDESVATPRFDGALLRAFAALALVLAVVGMYGVLAFAVRQRAREIGIRMALGEGRGRVVGGVLREGFGLALLGGAVGFAGAIAASRFLRAFVWGDVQPVDPLTYAGVFAVLALATLIASWIPARRAASVDPALTLRGD